MFLTKQRTGSRRVVQYNKYLYHFTHPDNIPSIKKFGLLSWIRLESNGILYRQASTMLSHQLDSKKRLEDYVRLSLYPKHPMADAAIFYGRVDRLVFIKINSAVLNFSDTLFSNVNAAANNAVINNDPLTALNSSSIQAEILVKEEIPVKYIHFSN